MTSATAQTLPLRHQLRVVLGQPAFLRRLTSYVRRAVPPQEVEDVTQSVLCAALAAEAIPDTPEDMAPWVRGIARHKVADFHRAASREVAVEAVEPWTPPPPVEARSVLSWIARQVEGQPRNEESLDWLLREGAGERLDVVAKSVRQSPVNVRQRVCRLRSSLRKRWVSELAVAAITLTCLLLVLRPWDRWATEGIAPAESAGSAQSNAILTQLQGNWHLVALSPDKDLDPARLSLARVALHAVDVRVEGNLLSVTGPGSSARRTMTAIAAKDGAIELTFHDSKGDAQQGWATLNGDGTLTVVSRSGPWRGTAVLAR